MSLEAALDEERREVMNILEGRPTQSRGLGNGQASSSSPAGAVRNLAPPVRSMLDIGDLPAPKYVSSTGQTRGSSHHGVRSMLDIGTPDPTRGAPRTPSSPETPHVPSSNPHRARSDALEFRPRPVHDREAVDPRTDYQFSMLPSIQNQALPKRVTQGGKKSIAPIMQGQEYGSTQRGRDGGRHHSTAGNGGGSKSPSSRAFNRSQSPGIGLMPGQGKYITESGKVIDMNTAYRRLNEAALFKPDGGLSNLSKAAGANAGEKGEALSAKGEVRLQKDHYPNEGDGDGAGESSDDEGQTGSSGDEPWGQRGSRGRRRGRQRKGTAGEDVSTDGQEPGMHNTEGMVGFGKTPGPRQANSLLAAAEEERVEISSRQKVKSLLDPVLTVTGPSGEKMSGKKSKVHPNTNYDQTNSEEPSPTASDTEEISDIRHAQRMSLICTPIDSSVPDRAIRTIIRGDFPEKQREAAQGTRRLRTYLVATDLSGEAAYALEWTIGTVLRDGDTVLAVYAVDEEGGTGRSGEAEGVLSLPIGEGAKSMRETSATVERMTLAAQSAQLALSSSLAPKSRGGSSGTSADSRYLSKAQQERLHAIEGITQTCIKFLRKTKLQVRIGIEVIHCKSPKHMITEAIDGLEPTLVVLGSRGRSALKGVLLGSFSNYLVTKSSVPVMVVRKRLSGRKTKHATPKVPLANNLTTNTPFSWDPIKVD